MNFGISWRRSASESNSILAFERVSPMVRTMNFGTRLFRFGFFCLPLLLSVGAAEKASPGSAKVEDAVSRIGDYAREAMDRTGIPGLALAVVYRDEAILLEGFGTRRAGESLPVDADTVFQLASLSKPMSSSVIAAAVDRGWIDWTDPVADYHAGLRLSDLWLTANVQVADLLSHRSGLPDHAGDYLEDLGFSRGEILQRVGLLEPQYPFRAGYAYTNYGFSAAGVAAGNAAGTLWEDLADDLIFSPMGMTSSSFRFEDYRQSENRADIHVRGEGGTWSPLHERDPDAQTPAGGLSTSMADYVKWMRMQLAEGKLDGEEIVSSQALSETWRPHAQKGYDAATHRAGYYALGWGVGVDDPYGLKLSHSGAFDLGVRTCVYLYPEEDLGIAIFANGGTNGVPEAIALAFEDWVFRGGLRQDWIAVADRKFLEFSEEFHLYQVDPADRPSVPEEPGPAGRYTGTYRNPYYGTIEVIGNDGSLAFRIGPEEMVFELQPWDGDTFLFQPRGENAGGPGKVIFQHGDGGRIFAVRIPYLEGNGFGTFSRSDG